MLLIPWAGLSFVLELDSALRQQTLQQLQTQSTRLTELADDLLLGQPAIGADPVVYARPVQTPGDTFVWPSYEDQDHRQPWQSAATSDNEPQLRWQAAADDRYLYLLTDVQQHSLTPFNPRSEEHTSELQSRPHLVCRLLLEKK